MPRTERVDNGQKDEERTDREKRMAERRISFAAAILFQHREIFSWDPPLFINVTIFTPHGMSTHQQRHSKNRLEEEERKR